MKKLLIINSVINTGSTGRIAEEIGKLAESEGFDVTVGYGFRNNNSSLKTIQIGSKLERVKHAIYTRFTDRHGYASRRVTKKFIRKITLLDPDIIHLHNIHGYYINFPMMMNFLKNWGKPVIWTLHDCWSMTGHCAYFEAIDCDRWLSTCHDCPGLKTYPASTFSDHSRKNFLEKKHYFNSLPNLTIVTPSKWLADIAKKSFLGNNPIINIYNGINHEIFQPASSSDIETLRSKLCLNGKHVLLGVAGVWAERKGLTDFKHIAELLRENERIILVGIDKNQSKHLPKNILTVNKTENISQLALIYSLADCFLNPTYEDTFPTTNLEAMACGTPVVTYRTGGSPEAIDETTGIIVEKGNHIAMLEAARSLYDKQISTNCRNRVIEKFNHKDRFRDYISLFKNLTDN